MRLFSLATITLLYCCVAAALGDERVVFYREFNGHTSSVDDLSFDPKSEVIVSGGADGMRLWSIRDGKELAFRGFNTYRAHFLDDNRVFIADTSEGLIFWDRRSKSSERIVSRTSSRVVADISPSATIAVASFCVKPSAAAERPSAYDIEVWKRDPDWQQTFVLQGHRGPVLSLKIHPSESSLLSQAADGTYRAWNLKDGTQIAMNGEVVDRQGQLNNWFSEARSGLAFGTDGKIALCSSGLYQFPEFEKAGILNDDRKNRACAVTTSHDGAWFATGHSDGTVAIWDSVTQKQLASFKAMKNGSAVHAVCFSPDDSILATAGYGMVPGFRALREKIIPKDTTVRLWRLSSLKGN
ncbi:WD40 repeat domain-containing protein [Anatilimnocola sp. NA78]|uniref:WD40 repeat domain-containing protein n=1 Tax=Anatilimnocola sp. NA78 TaxID=3415683 RepID=UPI003CE49AB3